MSATGTCLHKGCVLPERHRGLCKFADLDIENRGKRGTTKAATMASSGLATAMAAA